MSKLIEIHVPDIGDYSDVPVIEVLVKVGDVIEKEQSVVTLESDKATMDVPSSHAGLVKEIKVKVGDLISEGALVLVVESSDAAANAAPVASAPAPQGTTRDCAGSSIYTNTSASSCGGSSTGSPSYSCSWGRC
jgi:pyruvate dehydrogenase E2 component (dihydrolipoamide acetyltransferase)